jgi:hypothetical protein
MAQKSFTCERPFAGKRISINSAKPMGAIGLDNQTKLAIAAMVAVATIYFFKK